MQYHWLNFEPSGYKSIVTLTPFLSSNFQKPFYFFSLSTNSLSQLFFWLAFMANNRHSNGNGNHPYQNGNHSQNSNGGRNQPYRMGPLIEPPPDFTLLGRINFSSSAIGRFVGINPPSVTVVQEIVRSRWIRRDDIRVHRTGFFYIFECRNREDLQGLLRQKTAVIDGRLINFRRYHTSDAPHQILFNTSRIWVRIHGLPLPYLTRSWARRILEQIGYVDELDFGDGDLPRNAELRGRIFMDISLPFIPGCFIPLMDGRVI